MKRFLTVLAVLICAAMVMSAADVPTTAATPAPAVVSTVVASTSVPASMKVMINSTKIPTDVIRTAMEGPVPCNKDLCRVLGVGCCPAQPVKGGAPVIGNGACGS